MAFALPGERRPREIWRWWHPDMEGTNRTVAAATAGAVAYAADSIGRPA